MRPLRTPGPRLAQLPGHPFEPRYHEIPSGDGGSLRVHDVDEGPRQAAPVLMLHGEPSWSYPYRKRIPRVVAAGHRAVAQDLVGFGHSARRRRARSAALP